MDVRLLLAAAILGLAVPDSAAAACGGEEQTPCKIWERIPSCDSGLKEDFARGKCVKIATPCGAVDQRPCQLVERVLSCNPGLYEDVFKGKCLKKEPCGAADQRACRIDERIPSCDKGLYEDLGQGKCFIRGDFLRDGFGKCVHVPEVSTENGVQLRTWDCVKLAHLTWETVGAVLDIYTDEEIYKPYFWIKNRLTGKCAAVHAGQKHDGAWVVQWDCESGKNFQWGWSRTGQLVHRESGKCLYSESGVQNAGLTIMQCAAIEVPKDMQWTYTQIPEGVKVVPDLTPENPPGSLKNGLGSCLQVPEDSADGAQLTTWHCDTALTQILWVQEKGITVDRTHFFFKNRLTGACAAVHAGQKHDGAWAVQWHCGGEPQGENFHWKWADGRQLVQRESGKCLRVASNRTNAPVTLQQCIEIAVPNNKMWTFVRPGGETYR